MSSSFYFKERFSLIQFIFSSTTYVGQVLPPFLQLAFAFLSMLLFVLFYYKMKQSAHPFSLKRRGNNEAAEQIAKKKNREDCSLQLSDQQNRERISFRLSEAESTKNQPLIFFCHIQHSVHSFQKAQTQEVPSTSKLLAAFFQCNVAKKRAHQAYHLDIKCPFFCCDPSIYYAVSITLIAFHIVKCLSLLLIYYWYSGDVGGLV